VMGGILNTRPIDQAQNLTQSLQTLGIDVFHLPMIDIVPLSFSEPNLSEYQHIIFQSQHAVMYFAKMSVTHFPASVIAIGPSTKQALQNVGISSVVCPDRFDSIGILALPIFKAVRHQKILIVCGEHPRLTVANTLQHRGALIQMIKCYRRLCPTHNMSVIFPRLVQQKIDFIVSTSVDSLQNLLFCFRDHRNWLLDKTLCVVSDAMRQFAQSYGFRSILKAKNATNEALREVIYNFLTLQYNRNSHCVRIPSCD